MNLNEKIQKTHSARELDMDEIEKKWTAALTGNSTAKEELSLYYMKQLLRIKPLYAFLTDDIFYDILEKSIVKALDRGIRFKVMDVKAYMDTASQTYFKHHLQPEKDTLHIPSTLIKAFSKLDDVYSHISALNNEADEKQIELLSLGFEYPLFSTRLLYYSYKKWKDASLRQVDIDLTVSLLPAPQRIEWEVFYEKPLKEVENTIKDKLGK